jgi:uncharacterized ion transporter superfamily protein YfcC
MAETNEIPVESKDLAENGQNNGKKKFKLVMPHTWVLLFLLSVVAVVCTYVIKPGLYDRVENADGRMLVEPGSYHGVEGNPAGLMDLLGAFPRGLVEAALIVFLIFICGGAFFIVQKSGAIEQGISALIRKTRNKSVIIVPILSFVFAFGGGIYGMAEEVLPFIPILVMLSLAMGYDSITGVAITLVACCAGFTGAFLNPFTVGVAQGIADLPLFSGLGFRIIVFAVVVAITIVYLMWYCARIKKNPQKSPMYEIDQKRTDSVDIEDTTFTNRNKIILIEVLLTFVLLVFGVLKWAWYIEEIGALFFGMAIVVGITTGKGINNIADEFIEGCAQIAYGALIVGLARGILVILTNANVIDTIIYGLANAVEGLPSVLSAAGIYIVQIIISFIVPSGSGMAALTMPILAPLGDAVNVTRQTVVLAYQFADGFTNVITPLSGYFMAGLALAGIPYQKWIRWIMPLAVIWWVVGLIFVIIAHAISYGPF